MASQQLSEAILARQLSASGTIGERAGGGRGNANLSARAADMAALRDGEVTVVAGPPYNPRLQQPLRPPEAARSTPLEDSRVDTDAERAQHAALKAPGFWPLLIIAVYVANFAGGLKHSVMCVLGYAMRKCDLVLLITELLLLLKSMTIAEFKQRFAIGVLYKAPHNEEAAQPSMSKEEIDALGDGALRRELSALQVHTEGTAEELKKRLYNAQPDKRLAYEVVIDYNGPVAKSSRYRARPPCTRARPSPLSE